MSENLKGRSLLTLNDYSPEEIRLLLDTAHEYKKLKRAGMPHKIHEGKNIALLFEKGSTRTRIAFTVAATDLGVAPEFLGVNDIHLGTKESVEDTAKVLGHVFDGIEFRGFSQKTVETLAKYSGVPVWNGLTDEYHPTQVLADFITLEEHVGKLQGLKLVFVGDGRNNVATSLMLGAAQMGLDFRIAAPNSLHPDARLIEMAQHFARQSAATITITDDVSTAVRSADAVYTDVWVSMGEENKYAERIELLRDYQVNSKLLQLTNNPNVKFMHCLPAFHDIHTQTAKKINDQYGLQEMEVTDEVFRSSASIVFDQAENRMHTIKAVIALTL